MQEMEPLVTELKEEKLKAEQERDLHEVQVTTLKQQLASLQSTNEELAAEVSEPLPVLCTA
jgi:hypothetical protein